MGNRQSVKISMTLERLKRPNQFTYNGMSAILGSGNANEKSGSKNHSAQRTRPMRRPSGTPMAMAPARPARARHSVAKSGANVVPSTISVAQRSTISDTGGKTYGLTKCARVASSQASSTMPTGTTRVSTVDQRDRSMSECMPGHCAAQPDHIQPVQQVAEESEIEHHGEHRIVRAHAPIRADEIAE